MCASLSSESAKVHLRACVEHGCGMSKLDGVTCTFCDIQRLACDLENTINPVEYKSRHAWLTAQTGRRSYQN